MAEMTTYEMKGTLREECMKDGATLHGFGPLESDWRELFRWLMSVSGDLPYYDRNDRQNGALSSLWENNVLTVLVEILQKDVSGYVDSFVDGQGTAARQTYFERLDESLKTWISRLESFVRNNGSASEDSPAVTVAEQLIERMKNAMSDSEASSASGSKPSTAGVSGATFATNIFGTDDTNQPYYRMLGAVEDIQRKGDEYLALIESGGDLDASLALLLTFVRKYCGIVGRFNARFEGWTDFYRKNILHDTTKEAEQDSTLVVIEPDREHISGTFQLPKGTRFLAGQNADGADLIYATTEKAYIVPAHVRAVYSLFRKDGILHIAPASDGEQDDAHAMFDTKNSAAVASEYGWLLTSRSLVLSEGKRIISVSIHLEGTDGVARPDLSYLDGNKSAFRLQMSGADGWLPMTYDLRHNSSACSLCFTFTMAEGMEAPAACVEEIHGITTEYPALRILFADTRLPETSRDASLAGTRPTNASPSDTRTTDTPFAGLCIKGITITTEVEGIRNFTLIGESGQMDSSQPFYPFGAVGERGNRLIFGHEEVAIKDITSVTLKGAWMKLPEDGFKSIYENYGLESAISDDSFKASGKWQDHSGWHDCAGSAMPLFHKGSDGKLSEEAVFELVPKAALRNGLMPYHHDSNGFYSLTLDAPEIGFGMNAYYRRFTEVMMHNGRAKEKKQKPVPEQPQVPMLSDVTFGYRSEETLITDNGLCLSDETLSRGDGLYRFTDLFGYEKCGTNDPPIFMPMTAAPALLVGLDNMGDTSSVRLYFDLSYATQGWKPVGRQSSCKPVISRYIGNGIWQQIDDEDILCEETEGLTRSGFVEVKVPAVRNDGNIKNVDNIKNVNNLWLMISFEGDDVPENMLLNGLYLNCLRATAENGDGSALPAGTITAPMDDDRRILSVSQPVAGSGGKAAETGQNAAVRQRIRISTRNRAVCGANYEEMILERFPEIEKACCIPASETGGEVRIVIFPKPQKRKYPFLPGWTVAEVENYIKRYTSPFAKILVDNPVYEPLTVTFKAVLKDGVPDLGTVKRRIARRIRVFLMTWYMDGTLPDFGVRYSCNALLSRIANDESIGEFVSLEIGTESRQYRFTKEWRDEDIWLAASREDGVLYIDSLRVELMDHRPGVNEAGIGVDFMVG